MKRSAIIFIWMAMLVWIAGCSAMQTRKMGRYATAHIALAQNGSMSNSPHADSSYKDTLVIRNVDGRDMILMKSIRDDDGQMVANQVLEAAKVTAHFQNIAERHGKIQLNFQITVPAILMDQRFQLRYNPTIYMLGDSLNLDNVYVTGREYRRKQFRGYQQYERFLSKIISPDSLFIDRAALEIFLERNLPALYAFRNDSSFVSDEQFSAAFGVSEQEAVYHYTNKLARKYNEKRKSMKGRMFSRFVKDPICSTRVRIDTVLIDTDNDFTYNYTQLVNTRARLKRIDLVVDGGIYEPGHLICPIRRSDTLNFYVSSISSFVDDSPRYLTKIIERRAEASMFYDISFRSGSSVLDETLGRNAVQMNEIREHLRSLSVNDNFVLDSISVIASASPEGDMKYNRKLSAERSRSICRHLDRFMQDFRDSLEREAGFIIDMDSGGKPTISGKKFHSANSIVFKSGSIGENWPRLNQLVAWDNTLTESDKKEYENICKDPLPDRRERAMTAKKWYPYVKAELYPKLRNVNFNFHLHRKGMVKDTLHTTILDSTYMAGVQAIKDRDYDLAIELLRPYNDYNTAVAYCARDYNYSALSILEHCSENAMVNYMLAIINSRLENTEKAVEYYLKSCAEDSKYIHRGNLDPEIHSLIKTYNINF